MCNTPWQRHTVTITENPIQEYRSIGIVGEGKHRGRRPGALGSIQLQQYYWQPSCNCHFKIVKPIVLDPFFGAGTTGLAADELDCHCIGIELNRNYAKMAWYRIIGERLKNSV